MASGIGVVPSPSNTVPDIDPPDARPKSILAVVWLDVTTTDVASSQLVLLL